MSVNINSMPFPEERPPFKWAGGIQLAWEPILVGITFLALLFSVLGESVLGWPEGLLLALNILSYAAGGYFAIRAGFASLREGQIDVDLLMVAAAIGAALVGAWHEGATLLFLFSLSNVLQDYAIGRSRRAIQALLNLRPEVANVRRGNAVVAVAISDLSIGDVVVIKPGERLPADGVVIRGESTIDQATITGESMPITKRKGDPVFAGTVNQHGVLDLRVTKLASESTLARIITMVEEAQEHHSRGQRALDRFEQTYAKLVIGFVALAILIPPLIFGADFGDNFYRAMVILVVASPCALVISIPATVLSGIANAARKGILFKGGSGLEDLAGVRAIAFDKTGTITQGKPQVTDILPAEGISERDLLYYLASAERGSEHPLAQAILAYADKIGLTPDEPEAFRALAGQGLVAQVSGQQVVVGTATLIADYEIGMDAALAASAATLENMGKTTLFVAVNGRMLGVAAVADEVRPDAKVAIQRIQEAGIAHIVMLTGDNERVAQRIASEVGITEVYAGLMPDEKVAQIKALQRDYGRVAMVGDGVNDAPALATADLGIAMGAAGTDVAMETADIVLMANDLHKIPYALQLSRHARSVVYQNLAISLGVIVLLLTLNLLPGLGIPLPLGVVGHEGSTIVVVLNGLRLLVWKPSSAA